MNTELFARTGLSEQAINEALATWLKEKAPGIFEARRMAFCPYPRISPDPTESLDSMALVTDAMTPEERDRFAAETSDLVGELAECEYEYSPLVPIFQKSICADAPTRAVAAILALALGQETKRSEL